MFAKELKASDILNGEDVRAPRRYRITQLVQAISDRDEYRTRLREHAAKFMKMYPHLKEGAWFFGIAVPTVLTTVLALTGNSKVLLLTGWLVWLIAIIIFLVIIEHIRDSFDRQLALEGMTDDELRELFTVRNSFDGVKIPRMDGDSRRRHRE